MLNANLKMFDQDYIEALIVQVLPNAKVNDIVPLQAVVRFDDDLSPQPTNDYKLFSDYQQSRLFFGYVSFFGSILPYLIIPTPGGLVESFQTEHLTSENTNDVTFYSSPMPVLFSTMIASFGGDAKGSFHFIGFQISLDSFSPDTEFEPPVYTEPFNHRFAEFGFWMINSNFNSSGKPSYVVYGYTGDADFNADDPQEVLVTNATDDFSQIWNPLADTFLHIEKPLPFEGTIEVSAYRSEDGAKSDTHILPCVDHLPFTAKLVYVEANEALRLIVTANHRCNIRVKYFEGSTWFNEVEGTINHEFLEPGTWVNDGDAVRTNAQFNSWHCEIEFSDYSDAAGGYTGWIPLALHVWRTQNVPV